MELNNACLVMYILSLIASSTLIILGLSRYFVVKPFYNWYSTFYAHEFAQLSTTFIIVGAGFMNAGILFSAESIVAAGAYPTFIGIVLSTFLVLLDVIKYVTKNAKLLHNEILKKRS